MNIFVLDEDIEKCAQYHCDKHVVKMLLEYAQILCTVSNEVGLKTPYRSTHVQHPCVQWAMESTQNWRWLRELAAALNKEFQYRFAHVDNHKSYDVAAVLQEPPLPDIGLTDHPQVMPEMCRVPGDPVQAYRRYYIEMKQPIATWKRRDPPGWYIRGSLPLSS